MTSLAIFKAASLLSLPVLTKRERFSGRGTSSAILRASRATLSGIMPEKRWMAWPALSLIASTTAGWLWPTVAHICPEVKSKISRPVRSRTLAPCAATTISS